MTSGRRATRTARVALGGALAALLAGVLTGPGAGPVAAAAPTGPWEPKQVLVNGGRVDGEGPSVAVTASGRSVAAWLQGARPDRSVVAAVRDEDAAGWSDNVVLDGAENPFTVILAAHGGGRVTVAWEAFDPQGDGVVWARTLGASGQWGPASRLTEFDVVGGQGTVLDVEIATGGGAAAVAWKQGQATWTAVSTADGGWSPARAVPDTSRGSYVYGLAVDPDGTVTVVGAAASDRDITAWRRAPGGPWRTSTLGKQANGVGRDPSVASNAGGDLAVAWTRAAPGTGRQAVLRTRPDGAGWGPLQTLPVPSVQSALAVTGPGQVTLFWQRPGATVTGELERRTLDGQLQWRRAFGETTGAWDALDGMAVGAGGAVVLVYLISREQQRGRPDNQRWAVRCATGGACEGPSHGVLPPWWRGIRLGVDGTGAATFVWGSGSRGEEGLPTGVASLRLLAP